MTEAVIVSAARTAVGRANKGTLADFRPEDMGAAAVAEAVRRAEGLEPRDIDDLIMGCAMPEGSQGLNMGRIIALRSGLPDEVAAQTVNRFCSSGLQTIALGAQQRGRLGPLFGPLVALLLVLQACVVAMLWLRGQILEAPWLGGLPLAAAVQVYGLFLTPLGLVSLAYAWTFERFGLRQEDLDDLRRRFENRPESS